MGYFPFDPTPVIAYHKFVVERLDGTTAADVSDEQCLNFNQLKRLEIKIMVRKINNLKDISRGMCYYIFGGDVYTDKMEIFLHTLKRTSGYAGRLDRKTDIGVLLEDHDIMVISSTWAEDVDFLLANGIQSKKIIVLLNQVGDQWGFYDFMNGLLDQLDVVEDGQSWRIPFKVICDKLVNLESVVFELADGTRIIDMTCFHSNLAVGMGRYINEFLTVANGFSDEKSKTLYIDLLRWDYVTKIDYYVREIFNKSQYFEYITLRDGDVVLNCGVASGSEIPYLIGMVGVEGRVHCIDPNGLKYLDDYVKPTIKYFKDSIITHEVALMGYTGQVQFMIAGNNGNGSNAVADGSDNSVTFPCFTIDDFVEKIGLVRLDLIKLDLEGAEFQLMDGIVNLCKKFRCQVAITIYHTVGHLWEIPLFFMERLHGYSFHLGSYSAARFEIILYMIPNMIEIEPMSDILQETVLTSMKRDPLGRNCSFYPDILNGMNRWVKLEY